MIIDSHVHIFPDRIAKRTLEHLSATSFGIPYYTDGTFDGTLRAQADWGISLGIVLPIATKPEQQTSINNFAAKMQKNTRRMISCGSVHPAADDAVKEVSRIKKLGLYGVKLHPDYQGCFFDDEQYYPLYEKIQDLALPVVLHAGWDAVSPDVTHAEPKAIAKVAKAFPELILVAAHMGGLMRYQQVLEHLVGLPNVYFDTAMSSVMLQQEEYLHLIRAHGANGVLFGTDSPWNSFGNEFSHLQSLGLTDEEMDLILFQNACDLFGIEAADI